MKLISVSIAILILCLVGCSTTTNQKTANQSLIQANPTLPIDSRPIGGNVQNSMDQGDKDKLSHALDKPLGKMTQWENSNSKISYSVVPTKKLTINSNNFCREYTVTSTRGNSKNEYTGTACVSPEDNNWQAIKK